MSGQKSCFKPVIASLYTVDLFLIGHALPYECICVDLNLCVKLNVLPPYTTLSAIIYPSKQHVNNSQSDRPFNASICRHFICRFTKWVESYGYVGFFKGNFWVIVMSSRRQQHCGCSRHGAQLSASTCRSQPWLFRVVLSNGIYEVPPLCYIVHTPIMRRGLLW